jgi:hypothetical protein
MCLVLLLFQHLRALKAKSASCGAAVTGQHQVQRDVLKEPQPPSWMYSSHSSHVQPALGIDVTRCRSGRALPAMLGHMNQIERVKMPKHAQRLEGLKFGSFNRVVPFQPFKQGTTNSKLVQNEQGLSTATLLVLWGPLVWRSCLKLKVNIYHYLSSNVWEAANSSRIPIILIRISLMQDGKRQTLTLPAEMCFKIKHIWGCLFRLKWGCQFAVKEHTKFTPHVPEIWSNVI